ncbi:AAA-ATPase At2g18193-like [Corylus avellana]|uniref:AAA-ATPase At2g18193-like n=1 Tax=Corylus avellana TaxID=13451 RepID=UPI001E20E983|nr:AAA-ATPase At2g18193-like [Corylus avellana]
MISGLKNTTSSWFEAYAALSTSIMILQTAINQLLPLRLRTFVFSILKRFFSRLIASCVTLTIDESWDNCRNQLYVAAKEYLHSKITHANKNLRVGNLVRGEIAMAIQDGEAVEDVFDKIKVNWRFCVKEDELGRQQNQNNPPKLKGMYVLTFSEKDRKKVMDSYLPHVLSTYKAIKEGRKTMSIYNRINNNRSWTPLALNHPSTFDTLAIEPELKKGIINDLDRFLRRKDFYKKIGKPWKRGYLLYGPPGTGKSSMIAAMANYLKFDVYNLDLATFSSDSELMSALRETSSRSLIVVEDIDCNKVVHDRSKAVNVDPMFLKVTLSGILNAMDGLWSGNGDERIIVFTTNHKERLDPALLRPGRMDMHIYLSFCTFNGFRILASNYLDVQSHPSFEQVESLLEKVEVTPATIAEELLKSDDADVVLGGLVEFLKQKEMGGVKKEG